MWQPHRSFLAGTGGSCTFQFLFIFFSRNECICGYANAADGQLRVCLEGLLVCARSSETLADIQSLHSSFGCPPVSRHGSASLHKKHQNSVFQTPAGIPALRLAFSLRSSARFPLFFHISTKNCVRGVLPADAFFYSFFSRRFPSDPPSRQRPASS